MPHVPERRCLGCGRRAPKHEFARFTGVPGDSGLVLVRDDLAVLGGRGLYVCRSRECFDRARERRGFSRGARAAVMVDPILVDGLADERR